MSKLHEISVCVNCGRASVFLCTVGFVDDVMLSHNGANTCLECATQRIIHRNLPGYATKFRIREQSTVVGCLVCSCSYSFEPLMNSDNHREARVAWCYELNELGTGASDGWLLPPPSLIVVLFLPLFVCLFFCLIVFIYLFIIYLLCL